MMIIITVTQDSREYADHGAYLSGRSSEGNSGFGNALRGLSQALQASGDAMENLDTGRSAESEEYERRLGGLTRDVLTQILMRQLSAGAHLGPPTPQQIDDVARELVRDQKLGVADGERVRRQLHIIATDLYNPRGSASARGSGRGSAAASHASMADSMASRVVLAGGSSAPRPSASQLDHMARQVARRSGGSQSEARATLQAMADVLFGPGRDGRSGSTAPLDVQRPSAQTMEAIVHRVVDASNGSARSGHVRQMLAGMTEAI